MEINPTGKIIKGWGYESIWVSNEKYCSKFMVFEKAGNKFSMHFHKEKEETWFVQTGKFVVRYIDTVNARMHEQKLYPGDTWHNAPMLPHQLESLEDNSTILEVSTKDIPDDNYRVLPGDSQHV